MKYYEVKFIIDAPETAMQDARDILAALAGEAGFETFEDTPDGLTGYVQQSLFSRPLLHQLAEAFPLPACQIHFTIAEAEDKDWNEQWEQEGFEPIVVSGEWQEVRGERLVVSSEGQEVRGERLVVIHDGRHLPQDYPLTPHLSPLIPHLSPHL